MAFYYTTSRSSDGDSDQIKLGYVRMSGGILDSNGKLFKSFTRHLFRAEQLSLYSM